MVCAYSISSWWQTNFWLGDVFTKDKSLEDVASQWVGRLSQDDSAAVAELVNFILKSAGCSVEVTEDHINDSDNAAATIEDVQAQFQTVSLVC